MKPISLGFRYLKHSSVSSYLQERSNGVARPRRDHISYDFLTNRPCNPLWVPCHFLTSRISWNYSSRSHHTHQGREIPHWKSQGAGKSRQRGCTSRVRISQVQVPLFGSENSRCRRRSLLKGRPPEGVSVLDRYQEWIPSLHRRHIISVRAGKVSSISSKPTWWYWSNLVLKKAIVTLKLDEETSF